MNVTDAPSGILDPQQPYWPADKVSDRIWLKLKGKLTGRPIAELGGEQYTSYVRLSEADADRLIENIKKYGQYPQVNQNDKYGGAYNNEQYQKWLVEEFLEKPFSAQVDEKIANAAIESRLKEIQEKKEKAQSFISSSSKFGFGSRTSIQTRIPGVIPKRSIPTAVITSTPKSPEVTSEADPAGSESTFGRLLLNFVQINNDLEAIKEVIEDDFKTTKEKNKQELDEYKKRVANRGRKLTKKELGSDKKSVTETIKPFISNFFSGAGGAIRSLALLKMLLGILNGDISAVFKGLFGIGLSFLPKIGMMIAGGILKNLLASMTGRAVGAGVSRGVGGPAMRRAPIAASSSGIGKWAKIASLGAGALALGSTLSTSNQDQQPETQRRLEELTVQQKSSPETSSIPQEDIKKFEQLNIKFEKALEFFIETYKKTMQDRDQQRSSSGPRTSPSTGQMPGGADIPNLENIEPGAVPSLTEFTSVLKGTPMEAEATQIYEMALKEGLNPAFVAGLAGAESSFGTKGKAVGRTNPFNYGLQRGQTYSSYTEATQGLARALRDPQGYYAGEGRFTLPALLERYSPSSDNNNIPVHMRNIRSIGAEAGGDASVIFIPRGFNPATGNAPSSSSLIHPTARPNGRRASALSGSGAQPMVAVNVVPVPSNKPQAVTPNSGTNIRSIDPSYSGDRFSLLTAGELNLVGDP